MTRRRIPCTLSSRVISPSSHSGSLGRVSTLGKIGQMALLFVHGKCHHYYESGHTRRPRRGTHGTGGTTSQERATCLAEACVFCPGNLWRGLAVRFGRLVWRSYRGCRRCCGWNHWREGGGRCVQLSLFGARPFADRKSTRLNSSHQII